MRALKTILIILAALGMLVVTLGVVGPKSYRVQRSTEMNAKPELVYAYVSNLASMKEWGPWPGMDKDQVGAILGTDGTVGAVWTWDSDTVGRGSQELVELVENERVRTKLTLPVPIMGASESRGTYDLEPTATGTRLTWGLEGKNGFLGSAMSVFINMDAQVGPHFERGLATLKDMAETAQARITAQEQANTFNGFLVHTIQRPAQILVGTRATVPFSEMKAFLASSFAAAGTAIADAKLEVSGYPSTVFFAWNEKNGTVDVLAGIPVHGSDSLVVAGMDVHLIPGSTALHIAYQGDPADIASAHEAFEAMIEAKGLTEHGSRIEEYVTNSDAEANPAKRLTNIYCMVKD